MSAFGTRTARGRSWSLAGPSAMELWLAAAGVGSMAAAAVVASGRSRDGLLTGAVMAAGGLIAVRPLERREGPLSARVLLALAYVLLLALPATLAVYDPALLNPGPAVPSGAAMSDGLLLIAVGGFALAAGANLLDTRVVDAGGRGLQAVSGPVPVPRRSVVIGCAAVAAVALGGFIVAVGGPVAYLSNLDDTGSYSGLTYFIAGIFVIKFAGLCVLGERWRHGERAGWPVIASLAVGFVLIGLLGTRLLLLVSLAELLALYLMIRDTRGRHHVLIGALTLGVVLFIGVGELRRWQDLGRPKAFPAFLVQDGLPDLPRTYVNNYADGFRSALAAPRIVPHDAPFEYGKLFLRVALQPVPGPIRPDVPRDAIVDNTFGSAQGGSALPLPVEGYLQFGVVGAALFCLGLGALVGLIDRALRRRVGIGEFLALVAGALACAVLLRGSVVGSVAFGLIDLVGFWLVHRLLFRRARAAA